ncbi:unnamed protein product [Enterobius vermicularis]|uniref:TOX high mobility group box family member 2 n=1 Tax=Enterobius vermicularis TaxID=51028 RepID=A0A0N4V157_ENTVE|nr:unnamed protein product [Enterobius vermicularis]
MEACNSKSTKIPKILPEDGEHAEETKKSLPLLPNAIPLLGQIPSLSFQNLQLLLAYQNSQAQMPMLAVSQQLSKFAALSLSGPLLFPSQYDSLKELSLPVMPQTSNISDPSTTNLSFINKLLTDMNSAAPSEPRRVESCNPGD